MDRDFSALARKFSELVLKAHKIGHDRAMTRPLSYPSDLTDTRWRRLSGQIVGVTGSGPFEVADVRDVVTFADGYIGSKDVWQQDQMMVVGEEDFDEEYLRKSIEIGLKYEFACEYLSQQAFLDLLLNGIKTVYYKGDPRIQAHKGLDFLASIGFEWPSTDATPGNGSSDLDTGWKETSVLAAKYGYSVRKEVSIRERQEALKRAVSRGGLGLQGVVEHIAFLVRINKARRGRDMDEAIERWEYDLNWLHKTYYEKSLHSFVWPSY